MEAEKRFKTNKSTTSTTTTLLSRTKQDENNKLTHIGERLRRKLSFCVRHLETKGKN